MTVCMYIHWGVYMCTYTGMYISKTKVAEGSDLGQTLTLQRRNFHWSGSNIYFQITPPGPGDVSKAAAGDRPVEGDV